MCLNSYRCTFWNSVININRPKFRSPTNFPAIEIELRPFITSRNLLLNPKGGSTSSATEPTDKKNQKYLLKKAGFSR